MPDLSLTTQAFVRIAYGIMLFGMLSITLPQGRRFFLSERWGGYARSSRDVDAIQNPVIYPFVMAGWFCCAAFIAAGWWTVWAALVNLLLCRYFFIHMRWRGVARGMGAPGFMTYWFAAAIFLLEFTLHFAPEVRPLSLLALQVDFAFIMLSAGLYKLSAGYLRNQGMEYGLANPEWGYWWGRYAKLPPTHWLFKVLNHLAWSSEVVTAFLTLIPPTRFLGGVLIIASFLFVATQIRLGFLCEMAILAGVLYFPPGSVGDLLISRLVPAAPNAAALAMSDWPVTHGLLAAGLWTYLFLLPLAHGGLFYNLYAGRALPAPLQRALERYTNFFGIIIWRVFSADLVNFFILIYHQPRTGGARTLISRYGWRGGFRFNHVCESITVTSLFTTLKYYPSNAALFQERLLRYARTVPCPADAVLVFEYVAIRKITQRFEFIPAVEYIVDVTAGMVEEHVLSDAMAPRATHPLSPVHESVRPGSYAPLEG